METWLKRLVLAAVCVLLATLTVFVWRLSVLVQRLDGSVEALSSDVKTVTHEASEVASEIGRFRSRLDGVEDVAARLFEPDELLEEIAAAAAPADPVAASEINHLLDCIGRPGLTYQYGGDTRGAAWVQTKLGIKYRAYLSQIQTAEDFIDKVASETHDNETYYVVQDGEKRELRAFLTEALAQFRAPNPGEASTPATP